MSNTFGEIKIGKTRKAHKCIICNRQIPKGKLAIRYNGIFEGDWQNWRVCKSCEYILNNISEDYIGDEDFIVWLENTDRMKCSAGCRTGNYGSLLSWEFVGDTKETIKYTCNKCGKIWEEEYKF